MKIPKLRRAHIRDQLMDDTVDRGGLFKVQRRRWRQSHTPQRLVTIERVPNSLLL
jgi:hypothetical protein